MRAAASELIEGKRGDNGCTSAHEAIGPESGRRQPPSAPSGAGRPQPRRARHPRARTTRRSRTQRLLDQVERTARTLRAFRGTPQRAGGDGPAQRSRDGRRVCRRGGGGDMRAVEPDLSAQASSSSIFPTSGRRLLIVRAVADSPAREVGREAGHHRRRARPAQRARRRGIFDLAGESESRAASDGLAEPRDTALVLHTSGTTSRPKIVPLTHANICSSGQSIALTLELNAGRPVPERHAAVPHPRPRRRGRFVAHAPARAPCVRRAWTPVRSSSGSTRSSRPGTRRSRRCTRRSWLARPRIARSSRDAPCGSSVPRRPPLPPRVLDRSRGGLRTRRSSRRTA